MSRLVVIGAGTLGGAVATRWVERGGEAVGLTRTEHRHAALREAGITPSTAHPAAVIEPDDRVLLSVSGSAGQADAARRLAGLAHGRAVFVGSTGIYGGRTGVIDATTPPGTTDRTRAAAAAEQAFRETSPGGVVIRLGGLYRTGRGPLHALLRRRAPPPGPPDRSLALIHYGDAATAIIAALAHARPRATYLGVVPPVPTREAFYTLACATHGLAAPRFTAPSGATRAWDPGPFLRDLLPTPAHPDWREATRA